MTDTPDDFRMAARRTNRRTILRGGIVILVCATVALMGIGLHLPILISIAILLFILLITLLLLDPSFRLSLAGFMITPKATADIVTHTFRPTDPEVAAKFERIALSLDGVDEAYFVTSSVQGASPPPSHVLFLVVKPGTPTEPIFSSLFQRLPTIPARVAFWPIHPDAELLPRIRNLRTALRHVDHPLADADAM